MYIETVPTAAVFQESASRKETAGVIVFSQPIRPPKNARKPRKTARFSHTPTVCFLSAYSAFYAPLYAARLRLICTVGRRAITHKLCASTAQATWVERLAYPLFLKGSPIKHRFTILTRASVCDRLFCSATKRCDWRCRVNSCGDFDATALKNFPVINKLFLRL